MTRKEAHAEAARMLHQAAELIDQAHGLAKAARTHQGIQTRIHPHGGAHVGISKVSDLVSALAYEATTTVCDDCALVISACDCEWLNAEVK